MDRIKKIFGKRCVLFTGLLVLAIALGVTVALRRSRPTYAMLCEAVKNQDIASVQLFLKRGVRPISDSSEIPQERIKGPDGVEFVIYGGPNSPMDFALDSGNVAIVKLLHQYGAKFSDLEHPLYFAATEGQLELVKYFVEEGLTAEELNAEKNSTEKFYVKGGILFDSIPHTEVIRYLLEHGFRWECAFMVLSHDIYDNYPLKPGETEYIIFALFSVFI